MCKIKRAVTGSSNGEKGVEQKDYCIKSVIFLLVVRPYRFCGPIKPFYKMDDGSASLGRNNGHGGKLRTHTT